MYDEYTENQLKIEEQPQHKIPGGQINETPGNLFDYENSYALAHWVSADCRFDVGLAKFFQARYSTRGEFRQAFAHEGNCIVTNNNHVFNLVIKKHQYDIPTLRNVESALAHMKEIAEERGVYKIALPRINSCTGGASWFDVKQSLINIFMGSDFDIRVVYLNEYIDGKILDPDMEKYNFGKDRKHIDGNLEKKYY